MIKHPPWWELHRSGQERIRICSLSVLEWNLHFNGRSSMLAHRCFWPRRERTESDTRSCDYLFFISRNPWRSALIFEKKYNTGAVAHRPWEMRWPLDEWILLRQENRDFQYTLYATSPSDSKLGQRAFSFSMVILPVNAWGLLELTGRKRAAFVRVWKHTCVYRRNFYWLCSGIRRFDAI